MSKTVALDVMDDDEDPNLRLLQAISDRRNKLLREMFHMIRLRKNVGQVLRINEDEEGELDEFLDKYDISENPEHGSINFLPENELFLPPSPVVASPPKEVPVESDDELDLIGTPARSTRHSPSGPIVEIPSVSRSRSEPRPSVVAEGVKDSPKSIPVQHDETPQEPDSRMSEDPDGEYEPEDEEVAVEEMVVDTETEAASPEVTDEGQGDEQTIAEDLPHQDEEAMEVDHEVSTAEPSRVVGDDIVATPVPSSDDNAQEQHPMDIDQDETPLSDEKMEDDLAVDSGATQTAEKEKDVTTQTEALPTVPIPTFRPPTPRSKPIVISAPIEPLRRHSPFNFLSNEPEPPPATIEPLRTLFNPDYTLPPLKSLPVEFNRKSRPSKLKRKKEKEQQKEQKAESDRKSKEKEKEKERDKDDFVPLGAARWNAAIRVNPVYKRLPKAMKCLSTKDWTTGMNELKLIRTVERIEFLKDGRWSFRQPKKQRGLGQTTKTHWDYLLEEMKWMRTDFREERKWKSAVAYNLSTAVLEWHAAESWEDRIAQGICVKWRRPTESQNLPMEDQHSVQAPGNSGDIEMEPNDDSQKTSMSLGDFGGSDDDDDEEQDKQSIVDPLDAAALLEDHLQANEVHRETEVQPKTEEMDDSSVLRAATATDVEIQHVGTVDSSIVDPSAPPGLVAKSGSQSSVGDSAHGLSKSKSSKITLYTPVRDRVVYSDVDKLFLDLEDFKVPNDDNLSADDTNSHLPVADLTSIFPDLQPFALYEPSSTLPSDSKRKSEKKLLDEWKTRIDETERNKICPVGQYMHTKPTLIGALQPALHWKNGEWTNVELIAISEDPGVAIKIPDDCFNDLFDSKNHIPQPSFKDARKPPSTHLWNTVEDSLLKSFADRFNGNWSLIAEMFNGQNQSISNDKRSVRECYERWKELDAKAKGIDLTNATEGTPPPATSAPPATPNQITTRGVKRLASVSVSSPTAGSTTPSSTEAKKRRRHVVIQDSIRRAAKKRVELQQKQNVRKPANVHETHGQLQKMAKYTPGQLSQMKQDKENQERQARNQAVAQAAQAAQAQAAHAQALAAQAQHQHAMVQQQQAQAQTQQSPPQQPHPNGRSASSPTSTTQPLPLSAQPTPVVTRPVGATVVASGVPQIRNQQVNISQQQRVPAPLISAAPRLTAAAAHQTQQILQARAAQQLQGQTLSQQAALSQMIAAHAVQVAQAQQAQGPNPTQTSGVNGNASAHMSPPSYVSRDATSSPLAHTSPPRTTATPSNAMNSPRPPSAQAQHPPQMASSQLQAVQQAVQQVQLQNSAMTRGIPGHYYPAYSQEQLLRMQALLLQQQAGQQVQSPNASFPS